MIDGAFGQITKITGAKVIIRVHLSDAVNNVSVENFVLNYISIGSLLGTRLVDGRTLVLTVEEIYEHDNKYLISEDNNGTIIKTSTIFNGIEILPELIENNLSYVVVDEDLIDYNIILNILDIVSNIIQGKNVEKNINKSYELIGNNTSFLYKKTIFKVKKDNK